MPCAHPSNPQLHGLGIRLSLYTLWFLIIFSDLASSSTHIRPSRHLKARQLTHIAKIFTFTNEIALFISLVIQSSSLSLTTLGAKPDSVDLYILMLLVWARLLFHVPLYLFKIFNCCAKGRWDVTRLRGEWYDARERRYRVVQSHVWMGLRFGYLVAVCGWVVWFWAEGRGESMARRVVAAGCEKRYGFLFGRKELDRGDMKAWHIVRAVGMIVVAVSSLLGYVGRELNGKRKYRFSRLLSLTNYNGLRYLRFVCHATVASLVIAAIELTIRYNGITGINDMSTSAQLIPLICTIVIVIWLALESINVFDHSNSSRDWYLSDGDSYTSYDIDSTWSGRSRRRREERIRDEIFGEYIGTGDIPRPPDNAHL